MGDATDNHHALRGLLGPTRAVLFDFDGPVCDLFGGSSTAEVAVKVKQAARRHWGTLDPDVEACHDSHDVLQRIRDMYDRPAPGARSRRPLELAESIVAQHESEAVETAMPSPHLATLVELLRGLGMRLVIVSNNAEAPIRKYLQRTGLEFEGVFGRDPHDARRMKPDPDCVHRALRHLALPPSSCLLVGDQPTDLKAARSAGTCFLGYTGNQRKGQDMRHSGADAVISSYSSVIDAAKRLLASRHRRTD
ncbi:HAD family hydrolase [Streptomyces chartreusis]